MAAKSRTLRTLIAAILIWALLSAWRSHENRRSEALETLRHIQGSLANAGAESLLEYIILPAAVQGRSAPEQVRFLRKALYDEISPDGIAALEKHGRFGPLLKLFPDEAEAWASQAGTETGDCAAFRMERNGHRAEVVLVKSGGTTNGTARFYRIWLEP